MMKTRFAPSPTGYLHIGGARTALFAWLYARKVKGEFLLRIEDTDRERSTDESIQAILDAMDWLHLNYDETPVYQTQRFDRYREVADQLLAEGKAYRCYCSKERLEALREEQMQIKQKPRYDGHCRGAASDENGSYVIRFKNPVEGEVTFHDFIRGEISVRNDELDDLILVRSDGVPTYNFTVVVDDWDMGMTHVIRGDDHINNTPRQINLFKALGVEPPLYGHLPMILGSDGKRLSKRHGAVSVMQYFEQGYFPEALLNYLVRLGWSHGDQEIFSVDEMIEHFDVAHISRSPATFNPEKLTWVNTHYMKTLPAARIAEDLVYHMHLQKIDYNHGPSLVDLVEALRERANTLEDLANSSRYFYEEFERYDEKAAKKNLNLEAAQPLTILKEKFTELASWQAEAIHEVIQNTVEELDLNMGKVGQPLRVATTGGPVSPPMDVTLALLGKNKTVARIEKALRYIAEHE